MQEIKEFIQWAKYNGNMVFICGNGGSAATAEHFTNDLYAHGVKVMCLNSNVSIVTKIANDHGYEFVFSDQLKVFANEKDLLIVFSVSGKSPNIVNAFNEHKGKTIKIFGEPGESYEDAEDRHLHIAHQVAKEIT